MFAFRCCKCHAHVELARSIIARIFQHYYFLFSAVGILGWVLCAPLMVVGLCIRDKPDVNDDDDWRDDLCLPCYYDVNFRYPGEKWSKTENVVTTRSSCNHPYYTVHPAVFSHACQFMALQKWLWVLLVNRAPPVSVGINLFSGHF